MARTRRQFMEAGIRTFRPLSLPCRKLAGAALALSGFQSAFRARPCPAAHPPATSQFRPRRPIRCGRRECLREYWQWTGKCPSPVP